VSDAVLTGDPATSEPATRESVWRAPARPLRPFVSWYTGYRQAGLPPGRHRGLPSPVLTFIVTLDDPVVIASHPDPRQDPGSYDTLLGGLHTSPALITHDGRQPAARDAVRPEVAFAWRRLRASHGAVSVAELAAETGYSARQPDRAVSRGGRPAAAVDFRHLPRAPALTSLTVVRGRLVE
jgi:hypothetical protein